MASQNLLSNEYSDHTVLKMQTDDLKINSLNVSQLGRFQLFPNNQSQEGFNWSSTLRTASILRQLADKKPELTKLGFKLLEIARDTLLSLEEKNAAIEKESQTFIPILNQLGFPVKSFKMASNKLFNPGVSPNLLWKNPDNYIKGPAFVLEDTESFTNRLNEGFKVMFDGCDIFVTAQEMEFGESDGINFTNVHDFLLITYDSYKSIIPLINSNATINVTYYNKNVFKNITNENNELVDNLKNKLKCFNESDLKILVTLLQHLQTNKVYTVINIHADYSKASTTEPWKILRELFNVIPNLVVCGDFNLTLKNKSYFRTEFGDFRGKYCILQTPEPVDIGNPTYDLILSN